VSGIDTWKHYKRTQPEDDQVPDRIQDADPKVFDRKNVPYGLKEPFHYFTVVAVPPTFSIAFEAVSEKA
jgi:hypothetical protein